jgi:UDP-2,4-diacetamido-2,4,6-trideoxy-beta-L-altropyranose hydrolase
MGLGHLTRCLALSQAFMERGFLSRFIVQGDDSIDSVLQFVPYEKAQWLNGIENIKSKLQNALLVVDTFSISDELLDELSKISRVTILDDFIRREHNNHIVIDWTINAENKFYSNKNLSSRYLLGHEYIALRYPFWDCTKFVIEPLIEDVLITLGSGDIRQLIPRISEILKKHYPLVRKKIVIAGSSQSRKVIEALADSMTTIIVDANADEMHSIMKNADIAIASGGQTLYELACVGVPTISVMLIDNQLDDIEGWQEVGFTQHAGSWEDVNLCQNILSCFCHLEGIETRQERSMIGQKLVNGKGARLIVDIISAEINDY